MLESKNFVEVNIGTIPLIISVPHGGALEYEKIPKRENGIVGLDKATKELANKLISCIIKTFTEKKKQFTGDVTVARRELITAIRYLCPISGSLLF